MNKRCFHFENDIDKRWIRRVFDEVEKGFQQGVLETLGGLFLALGILGQKLEDVIRSDGGKLQPTVNLENCTGF
ncbi:MAG: hypothetical protein K9J79_12535 [Desulfobacteraceae bacterium]|nr:hypothetical protein [Desulfobacteraceae bacterium]MCF8096175.1 hypothetical protein [Desulfobacteraceae bacterium]